VPIKTYTCENCRREFDEVRPPGEAEAEFADLFPGLDPDDQSRLCEPCFIEVMEWAEAKGYFVGEWRRYLKNKV
jgi:hypothetical protein